FASSFLASFVHIFFDFLSFFSIVPRAPRSTLFPYTTLFRSGIQDKSKMGAFSLDASLSVAAITGSHSFLERCWVRRKEMASSNRSEEHTSELQSRFDLVCRLLLEKKNKNITNLVTHHVTILS